MLVVVCKTYSAVEGRLSRTGPERSAHGQGWTVPRNVGPVRRGYPRGGTRSAACSISREHANFREACVRVRACVCASDRKHKGRTGVGTCHLVTFLAACHRTVLLFWGEPPLRWSCWGLGILSGGCTALRTGHLERGLGVRGSGSVRSAPPHSHQVSPLEPRHL